MERRLNGNRDETEWRQKWDRDETGTERRQKQNGDRNGMETEMERRQKKTKERK